MFATPGVCARRRAPLRVAIVGATLAGVLGGPAVTAGQPAIGRPDPATFPFRDLTRELANKTTGTFTVAAVGDVLVMEPVSKLMDPKIVELLRNADTTVGNLESVIVDIKTWGSRGRRDNVAPAAMAADLKDLGFDMMNNATGHALDAGDEGLQSSTKLMADQGIPLSGIGPNLSTARLPVFHVTPKGRIGMVGANAGRSGGMASDVFGNIRIGSGNGWGINPLRLTVWNTVTAEQLTQLKGIRDSIVARRAEIDLNDSNPIPVPKDYPDRVQIFDANFIAAAKPGEYRYVIDKEDEVANLLSIRNTKEYSDFTIFTMHVHPNRYAFQGFNQDNYPNQFLIDYVHKLIDNGADMYVGHGPHAVQGVEIYKGRPIFYALGSLAQQQVQTEGSQEGDADIPEGMTPIESDELDIDRLQRAPSLIGLVATSKYQDGKLVEVRLNPVDLGAGKTRPWSKMGIAQTPSPEMAMSILTRVQKYSKPFGTVITIENGVGVIRVPPEATVPVGGQLRATFPKDFQGKQP